MLIFRVINTQMANAPIRKFAAQFKNIYILYAVNDGLRSNYIVSGCSPSTVYSKESNIKASIRR